MKKFLIMCAVAFTWAGCAVAVSGSSENTGTMYCIKAPCPGGGFGLTLPNPQMVSAVKTLDQIKALEDVLSLINIINGAVTALSNDEKTEISDLLAKIKDVSTSPELLAQASTALNVKFLNSIKNASNANVAPVALASVKLLGRKASEYAAKQDKQDFERAAALIAVLTAIESSLESLNLDAAVNDEFLKVFNIAKDVSGQIPVDIMQSVQSAVQASIQPLLGAQKNIATQGQPVIPSGENEPVGPPATATWNF